MIRISKKVRFDRAFTLVEMLVSMAILFILAATLVSMLSTVMSNWQQEQARGERRSTARRALTLMAHDLSLAALPLNVSDTNNVQFVIDPPAAGLASYLLPHALFWQAPVATDTSSAPHQGNLAIVGYFIRWVGTDACLCRLLVNPSSSDYLIYTNPQTWLSANLLTNSPASAPSYQGLIGDNVLGLWAQPLDINGNPITKNAAGTAYSPNAFDSRQGYSQVSGGTTYVYGPSALPAAVRIGVVVIDSRTAERLTPSNTPITPATPSTNFFGDIQTFITNTIPQPVRQGAEAYTQVVSLPHVPQ